MLFGGVDMLEVASDELLGLVCFNHSAIFAFGDLSFNLGVAAHFLADFLLGGVDLLEGLLFILKILRQV